MSAPTRFAGTTGHPGKAAKTDTKTGICVGMVAENANYGKVMTALPMKPKPSYRKGKLNKRVSFVKEVIREVVGFSPYEKRTLELLKVGKEKRALKLLKAKLGARRCPPPTPRSVVSRRVRSRRRACWRRIVIGRRIIDAHAGGA